MNFVFVQVLYFTENYILLTNSVLYLYSHPLWRPFPILFSLAYSRHMHKTIDGADGTRQDEILRFYSTIVLLFLRIPNYLTFYTKRDKKIFNVIFNLRKKLIKWSAVHNDTFGVSD